MSKSARGSKITHITTDDEPTVKKGADEEFHHSINKNLKEKLEQLEKTHQKLITISGEKQARIEYLEKIVDEKHDIVKKTSTNEEHVKRLNDLTTQLQLERRRASEEKRKDKEKIINLTNQLKEERERANEDKKRGLQDRLRDQEQIEALTATITELERQLSLQEGQEVIPAATTLEDVQPEGILHRDDNRRKVGVNASVETEKTDRTNKESQTSVDELCKEILYFLDHNASINQLRHGLAVLRRLLSKGSIAGHETKRTVLYRLYSFSQEDSEDEDQENEIRDRNWNEKRKIIHDSGFLPLVVELLKDEDDSVVYKALCVLDNVAFGDAAHTQTLLKLGTLYELPKIMKKKKENSMIIDCCCSLIRHMTAGTEQQIQAVVDNGLLPLTLKAMQTGDQDVLELCSFALNNLVEKGTKAQILSLLPDQPMSALCAVLKHSHVYCVENGLNVIQNLFSTADVKQLSRLKNEAMEAGVLDHLKRLEKIENKKPWAEVSAKASTILADYFVEKRKRPVTSYPEKSDDDSDEGDSTVANAGGVKGMRASVPTKKIKREKH